MESSGSRPSLKTPFPHPIWCILCWQPADFEDRAGERIPAANWLPLLPTFPNGPQNRPGNPCFRSWKLSSLVWNVECSQTPGEHPAPSLSHFSKMHAGPGLSPEKSPCKGPCAALTIREMVTECVTHTAKTCSPGRSCLWKSRGAKRTTKIRSLRTSKTCRKARLCR